MAKQKQIIIRVDEALYEQAKAKCHARWGIGLSPLIKVFLKSFVTQEGVGFFIGNQNLKELFNRWLAKKSYDKEMRTPFPRPRLKDLYDL